MTRPRPAAIEDRKNETGNTGDHHCGASEPGIRRNSDPSELWCIVEKVTAAIASMIGSPFLPASRKLQARTPKMIAVRAAKTAESSAQKIQLDDCAASIFPMIGNARRNTTDGRPATIGHASHACRHFSETSAPGCKVYFWQSI